MSVTQQRPRVTVPRVVEMKARGEKVDGDRHDTDGVARRGRC